MKRKSVAGAMFIAPAARSSRSSCSSRCSRCSSSRSPTWSGFNVGQISWGGVSNFHQLGSDPVFREALEHTVIFVAVTTVALNAIGLPIALLLNTKVAGHEFLRVALFLPLGLSPVLTAILWGEVLGPYGLINQLVVNVLHLTSSRSASSVTRASPSGRCCSRRLAVHRLQHAPLLRGAAEPSQGAYGGGRNRRGGSLPPLPLT